MLVFKELPNKTLTVSLTVPNAPATGALTAMNPLGFPQVQTHALAEASNLLGYKEYLTYDCLIQAVTIHLYCYTSYNHP